MLNSKEYFKEFYNEIEKYSKGIHALNYGISEEKIVEFEENHQIKLPYYFREFLKINNGGELFANPVGTILGEVLGDKNKESGIPYLEYNFDDSKRWPNMPETLFIIADTCDGDMICLDLSNADKYDCNIVCWSHEEGEIDEEWATLREWLLDEMDMGKMSINYDGSDK